MRTSIFRAVALTCCFLAPPALAQTPDTPNDKKAGKGRHTLTILHTGDIHGHVFPWRGWEGELDGKTIGGLDRLASAVKEVHKEVPKQKTLLLDAGDTFGDTMLAAETKGEVILKAMNLIGYDAMVAGNHEPDFTAPVLKERIRQANFPILAANIVDKKGQLFAKPFVIKEVDGLKIGIVGISYPNTPLTTSPKNIEGLRYLGAVETARKYVPKVRKEGAQLVVALTHYGLGADLKLANAVPGIDVIVGGHSHNRTETAYRVGDTLVVHAGAHGSDLGRLDLVVENGKVISHQHRLMLLDNAMYGPDAAVSDLIRNEAKPHENKLQKPLANAKTSIVRAQTIAGQESRKRDEESPADSLFADIILEKTGVDAVFLPSSGYGVAIPAGVVEAQQLKNLKPHDGKVFTMKLKGSEIRNILEESLEGTYTDDPKRKVGGLVQVGGLEFSYDPKEKKGHRVKEVTIGGKPLEPGKTYRVATNSLLSHGGHHLTGFLKGQDRKEAGSEYELLAEGLKGREPVSTPPLGRIKKLGESEESGKKTRDDKKGQDGSKAQNNRGQDGHGQKKPKADMIPAQ